MRLLFPSLLSDADWGHLAPAVQQLHGTPQSLRATGTADVEGSTAWHARLLRRILGLPEPGQDQPITFIIDRQAGSETWTRGFERGQMQSTLMRGPEGLLLERLGPVTLRFRLRCDGDGIDWQLLGARLLGMPLPRFLLGEVYSRSGAKDGRYYFHIDARPPWFGRLIAYRGWLEIAP
ncbi:MULTISPECIES: DUF4166 domain-containing protein [Dyella]|uniref:DUF4166 domain-containing protein n=2 Tax=Dyella TaxID=231454 RepID=A0A4R0YIM9_9GAMM|nr:MULTISPECIES: DUF4166 domain-containing protein [Dyella]TBR36606.1 DUF4166 domain-containing protein [Dyella terrae]TCI08302.1 DUF4166 domain-containing protein [Dyella soli]